MNSRLVSFFVVLILAVSVVSCRTTLVPESTGSMTGKMGLVDASCNWTSPDGVTIELLGTRLKAISDSEGVWKISGIPAGYFDIQFSKPGFAVAKVYNFEFVGSGTLYTDHIEPTARAQHLGPHSTTTVALANATATIAASSTPSRYQDDSIVTVSTLGTPTTIMLTNDVLILYGSKSPNIDPLDASTYFYAGVGSHLDFSEKMAGLRAGDTVYVTAAYMNNCSTLIYSDPSGNNIFPAVGPLSAPVPVVIP